MTPDINRRELLGATGAGLAVALAGCSAFADGRGVPGRTDPREDDGEDDGDGSPEGVPMDLHNWLMDEDTSLYSNDPSGNTEDLRGEDAVRVSNGAGSGFAFSPTVIIITPGTEVTWEWTGQGGNHNVSGREEDINTTSDYEIYSGETIDEAGHEWSFTFEEIGVARYGCAPHIGAGMFGAVVVAEEDEDPEEQVA